MHNEKTFDVAFELKLSIYKLVLALTGLKYNFQYSDYKKTRKKTINHFTSPSPSYRKEKKHFILLLEAYLIYSK